MKNNLDLLNQIAKFLLVYTLCTMHTLSYADSIICSKAENIAKQAYSHNDPYNKFLALEGIYKNNKVLAYDSLISFVDPTKPFLTRSAVSTILSINDSLLTKKLIQRTDGDNELADIVIDILQFYPADNTNTFIRGYLLSNTNTLKRIYALKASAKSENNSLAIYIKNNYKKYVETEFVQAYALYVIVHHNIKFDDLNIEIEQFSVSTDPHVREIVAVMLGEMLDTDNHKRILEKLVNDNDMGVKIAALTSLNIKTNGHEKAKLINILKSKNINEARFVVGSLKRMQAELALDILKSSSLNKETDIYVLLEAMQSVANLRGGDAEWFVKWGLKQGNEDLIIQSLFTVGIRNNPKELKLLEPYLESNNETFKTIASWAILKTAC